MTETKRCCRCHRELPVDHFYKVRKGQPDLQKQCKICMRENGRRWAEANPTKRAESSRKYREKNREKLAARFQHYYHNQKGKQRERETSQKVWRSLLRKLRTHGITAEQYHFLLEKQEKKCAICQKPARFGWLLVVDHDHKTGDVRGLLCGPCNKALGVFGDNLEGLEKASGYLKNAKPLQVTIPAGKTKEQIRKTVKRLGVPDPSNGLVDQEGAYI